MLNWLEHTLWEDEEVIFHTRTHKYKFAGPPLLIIFGVFNIYLLAAGLVYLAFTVGSYYYYEYVITSERVILKKGLFYISIEDIPIHLIEDVLIRQSIFDKTIRGGTLFIFGEAISTYKLKSLDRPATFRSALYSQIPASTVSYYDGA